MSLPLRLVARFAHAFARAAKILGIKKESAPGRVAEWVGKGADVLDVVDAAVHPDSLQAGRTSTVKGADTK